MGKFRKRKMASDLSSGCTDDIQIFDEKEEGEISLEDVSSSEESHPHYRLAFRNGGCPSCMSLQQCSPWCNSARIFRRRLHRRQGKFYQVFHYYFKAIFRTDYAKMVCEGNSRIFRR